MHPTTRTRLLALGVLSGLAAPSWAQLPSLLTNLFGGSSNTATAPATPASGAASSPAGTATEAAPAAAVPPPPPPTAAELEAALAAPVTPLDASAAVKGSANLKGKRYYISEYRVLFETGGSVTANTRAAYFGGTDYGATRMTINYNAPQMDMAALQAVTDKAYADFLARLDAVGAKPEPAEAMVKEFGAVYEATVAGSKPGAPVVDDIDVGYGKRKYLVFAPTGMLLNSRGFAGLGAGNLSNRMTYIKGNVEAISVVMAVNIAAQETSGGGSSFFRKGSSANASAAMEVAGMRGMHALQSHAHTNAISFAKALPVPGQFANLREVGGYDTRKDALVQGLNMLGRLTMGVAGNESKRVDMAVDVDTLALSRLALQGMVSVNQAIAGNIK